MGLKFEACAAMVAFLITLAFVVWPVPYLMALFTFVGMPLFVIVGLFFVMRVVRELHTKDVL